MERGDYLMNGRGNNQRILLGALGASLLLNLVLAGLLMRGPKTDAPPESKTVQGVTMTDGNQPKAATAPADSAVAPAPQAPITVGGETVADTAGTVVDPKTGFRHLKVDVKGSLAQTFQTALGEHGDLVSAVFSRIFVWKLDLRSDIRRGDKLELVYRVIPATNQADILTARFVSTKMNQTYAAYWYKPSDRQFGSYFDEKGVEIPLTLENGPIKDYEQITSLLKDRPKHKGMDFKAPVGVKIISPFAGKVSRINWNPPNGTCVEIEFSGSGVISKYLHLSRIMPGIQPGKSIAAGEVIAESGNTGHSTAPHLHYQLEKANGAVVDPLDFHRTINLTLPESARADFDATRQKLDGYLASGG